METSHSIRQDNGNYTTFTYTPDEIMTYDMWVIIFSVLIGSLLSILVCPLLILWRLYVIPDNSDTRGLSLIGIVVGLYVAIDLYFHWVVWFVLKLVEGVPMLTIMYKFNIGYLAVSVFLFIWGKRIYDGVPNKENRNLVLWGSTAIVLLFATFTLGNVFMPASTMDYSKGYTQYHATHETEYDIWLREENGHFKNAAERNAFFGNDPSDTTNTDPDGNGTN